MNILKDSYRAFVNLDHRTDRLDHIETQLERLNIGADRIRGMLPGELSDKPGIKTMMDRTPGAVGCHFSQVQIMERALTLTRHALVMEDDIIFCNDFNERIGLISEFLAHIEWDVFFLGGTFHVPAFWHRNGTSGMDPNCSAQLGYDCEWLGGHFVRTFGAFSTFAYFVNVKSIQKILDLFDKHLHTSIGIDWLFIKLQPQLQCFAFVPGCVKQMDNKSDIGDGMTIFSGFSKLNGTLENSSYWYQENMQDFNPNSFRWK